MLSLSVKASLAQKISFPESGFCCYLKGLEYGQFKDNLQEGKQTPCEKYCLPRRPEVVLCSTLLSMYLIEITIESIMKLTNVFLFSKGASK